MVCDGAGAHRKGHVVANADESHVGSVDEGKDAAEDAVVRPVLWAPDA